MYLIYLNDQQKIEIVEKYLTGNYTLEKLGKEYSRDGSTIGDLLRKRGLKINNDQSKLQRKYTLNENYFNKIDAEDKAYFLGLLYADGCNHEIENMVSISLQPCDAYILNKFNEAVGSNKPIKTYKNYQPNRFNKQPSCRMVISSKIVCNDLARLGCVQAKSLILKFPTEDQVPANLLNHFMRGYHDGDGSFNITTYPDKHFCDYNATVVSTESFCLEVQKITKNILDINSRVYLAHKNSNNKITSVWATSGRNQFCSYAEWIYKDATVYLTRKRDKYEVAKKFVPNPCGWWSHKCNLHKTKPILSEV